MNQFLRTYLITLLVAVFSTTYSNAQKYFSVIFLKGKAEVKSKKRWVDLKISDKVSDRDDIRLDREATLHLSDSAGVPLLFTLPGVYNVGDYYDNSRASQVIIQDGVIVKGRIARVKQNFFGSAAPIKVLLPMDSTFGTVYAKKFVIRWVDQANKGPYRVYIKNLFKATIATYDIPTVEMTFDLDEERFAKERVFYVVVTSVTDPKIRSGEHVFKRIISHERYRVDDILNKEIILDNSRALDQLVLAGFYEEHGLFTDAVNAYLESIRLGKNDPIYAEAFDIFLKRYGLE